MIMTDFTYRAPASVEDAVRLAGESDYGLSLGIVTRDVMRGVEIADRIPTGIVHINDQTVNDEANAPFGGMAASGTGSRFGGKSSGTPSQSWRPPSRRPRGHSQCGGVRG